MRFFFAALSAALWELQRTADAAVVLRLNRLVHRFTAIADGVADRKCTSDIGLRGIVIHCVHQT